MSMENTYVLKVRKICREIDKIEQQIAHIKSLNEHNQSQLIEYQNALNDKISELFLIRGEKEE